MTNHKNKSLFGVVVNQTMQFPMLTTMFWVQFSMLQFFSFV